MPLGKLIVIEGGDGSGKKTQTELLVKRALSEGYKIETLSFPQYEKVYGKEIKAYLEEKYGSLNEVSPYFAAMLYAADRLQAKPQLLDWLKQGKNIILDRYMESNIGHQAGKFKGIERDEMIEWIYDLELNRMGLVMADFVVYLDLPVDFASQAMEKEAIKDGKKRGDLHERDFAHLNNTRETYLYMAQNNKNWKIINCLFENNDRIPIKELNDIIWEIIKPILVK